MDVVKWSEWSPSIPIIQVRIPLMSTVLVCKSVWKTNNRNEMVDFLIQLCFLQNHNNLSLSFHFFVA